MRVNSIGAICGDDRYSARVIEACAPRLKVISKWGTGIDSIDAEACSHYQIKIGRTLNAFTQPVADTVLGYMLAFARRQPWMDKEMKAGKWEKMPGMALSECYPRRDRRRQHWQSRSAPRAGIRHENFWERYC
jgi:D-3-phosphoglycerate dehydrogenase